MTPTANKVDETLGRVTVELMVVNNRDLQMAEGGALAPEKVRRFQLEGIVDTGSTLLVLPGDVANRLGLPKSRNVSVGYADNRSGTRALVEQVGLELLGRRGTFEAIVEPDRTTALVGAVVLESLNLLVDCAKTQIYPRDPNHYVTEVE